MGENRASSCLGQYLLRNIHLPIAVGHATFIVLRASSARGGFLVIG